MATPDEARRGAVTLESAPQGIRGVSVRIATDGDDGKHASLVLHAGFFISGFCALVYQAAWQRMLGLFGGSDSVSATIVVGAFLFGLGLGSLAAAGFADRLSRAGAVVAFAVCELGIAACAALSPLVFYDLIFGQLVGIAQSPMVVLGVVFAALLPPTLLMGMSLPLLSRAVVHGIDGAAEQIGWLYGLNTLGAGLGALLAGAVVIGTVGYEATVYAGAMLNLVIGIAALLAAAAIRKKPAEVPSPAHALARPSVSAPRAVSTPTSMSASRRRLLGWCALVFASGFLIISLEIVWFRVLGTLRSSNAYSFSVILGVFLLADAAGIVAGARVVRRILDPLRFFLRLQGVVALCALGTLGILWAVHGFEDVTELFAGRSPEGLSGSGLLLNIAWLAVVGVTVAPPAFLLGMSFPVAQKTVQEDPTIVGMRVAVVQFANILGNTAGAVVTGLVLLHVIGTSGALRMAGALGLVLLLLAFLGGERARPRELSLAAALAALVVLFPGNTAFWSRLHMGTAIPAGGPIVAEDRTGIVVMRPLPDGVWMAINGFAQSRLPFLPVHGMLGAVGPLVHPQPRSVLVIGHAMGGTPYAAALATADVAAQVRVVEIVAPVFAAVATLAAGPDAPPALRAMLAEPRIERQVGDGRHAIFADDMRYDVIEADAIPPRNSHSGLLYSVAFFRQVRERLAPGGLAVQWAPTPRAEASFLNAFPHVLQLRGNVLLGSADRPVPYDAEALARRFATAAPGFAAAEWPTEWLRDAVLGQPLRVWGPSDPRPSDVNSDLFPKDEYFLNGWKLDLLDAGVAAR